MKFSPPFVGFLQAIGLTGYIASVALFLQHGDSFFGSFVARPFLGVSLFLLLFVFSALISALIVFGYPFMIFAAGKRELALQIVLWSGVWLLIIFLFAAALASVFMT